MSLLKRLLGISNDSSPKPPSHTWEEKRTYELPGPRIRPEVTVYECVHCRMTKDENYWLDPNPQYFEEDTREADRITDESRIATCAEREKDE